MDDEVDVEAEDYGWEPTIEGLQEMGATLCAMQLRLGPKPKEMPLIELQKYLDRCNMCVDVMIGKIHFGKEDNNGKRTTAQHQSED